MVTSLPTIQRRAALDVMLQPLVQTVERLLTVQPPGSMVLEASQRKELILATFDRMAVVFRCVLELCLCGPNCDWMKASPTACHY